MAKKKRATTKKQPKQRRESTRKEVVEEVYEDPGDQMTLGIIVMTGVVLIAAIVINMMHLGHFDVGPFK